MSARSILSFALAAFVAAAVAPAPGDAAEVPPGTYYVNLLGGSLHIGTPSPMDFPFAPAELGSINVPTGDQVAVRLPVAGQSLTPVTSHTAFGDVTVSLTFTDDVTGTATRSTGEVTTHDALIASITVGQPPSGFTCAMGSPATPIALALSTKPPGSGFNSALEAAIADDRFAVPALSDCVGIEAALANTAGFPVAAGSSRATMRISLVDAASTQNPGVGPGPAPGSTLPPPVTGITPRLAITGTAAAVRKGRVSLRLRCLAAANRCSGRLQLRPAASGPALGKSASFAIPVGRTANVRVTLRRAALSLLQHRGSIQARATVILKGAATPVTRRVVLRSTRSR